MIVKVKDKQVTKVREKREFFAYVMEIKKHVKIQMMLSKYTQHRKNKCIYPF